ncbi:Choline transport protein [Candida maltosa Xu316]|uniref:Choline transport protein n=1 Tax=Candida maltosa (strain Xu316) TaxID=1245528 RepID=M3IWR8_CANMX|nr:Choline transport protein [Candida maltosa Xu316]
MSTTSSPDISQSEKENTSIEQVNIPGGGGGIFDRFINNGNNNQHKLLQEAQANLDLVAATGYTPELKRGYSILSLLGVGFGLTNSWFGISGSLVAGISSGGPMMIIYGILILTAFSTCIGITLAELASAYPNAAGQIYWAGKLAPSKYSKISSYLTGLFLCIGSVFTTASVAVSIATAVVGMWSLNHPGYEIQTWQVFIVYEIFTLFLMMFNIWEKPLPLISKAALFVSLTSFLIITIAVPAMHKGEFQSARFVFVEFNNATGWSSSAIAFIVGLINPNWSFSCLDAATHIAEESLTPEMDIPKAIIGTVIIGFVTSFTYSIAMFFSLTNLDEIFQSTTGVPIMDIFYQATKSKPAALGLEFLILLTACLCSIQCQIWSSRSIWSFARDNGLPFSNWLSKVNTTTGNVVNAQIFQNIGVVIIGCIYLASTTAFNSILVSCVTFLLISYVPCTLFLVSQRSTIKHGPFWLGKFGLVANICLLIWALFAFIFYNFPAVMPVSGGNMNYSPVVFGLLIIFAVCDWYFRAKKQYISVEERANMKNDELTAELSHQLTVARSIVSYYGD